MYSMMENCGDNRFEVIAKAKKYILENTNIETSKDEMKVLDNILFRCWQMGWLKQFDDTKTYYMVDKDRLFGLIVNSDELKNIKHQIGLHCTTDYYMNKINKEFAKV